MPRTEASTPEPTPPEDDGVDDDQQVDKAVTFARRTHKAMGIAINELEKAARRGKAPADSRKGRPARG